MKALEEIAQIKAKKTDKGTHVKMTTKDHEDLKRLAVKHKISMTKLVGIAIRRLAEELKTK